VLLGGPGEVRTARQRGAARPYQLASAGNVWSEQLVLEIPRAQADAAREVGHFFCFGDVPRKRLFAGEPPQSSDAAPDRADNLFDVRDARLIGTAQP
jgi:hypothetical protein